MRLSGDCQCEVGAEVVSPPSSKRLGNLALAVVVSAVMVLVVDAALRLSGLPQYQPYRRHLLDDGPWEFDSMLGWSNVPSYEGDYQGTAIRHNALGLRDQEVGRLGGAEGPNDRVLVLGDSFVWGWGVDEADTFATRMESLDSRRDVVNMGVAGYSTDQEVLLYERLGSTLPHSRVLLVFYSDDLFGNAVGVNYLRYSKPRFAVEDGHTVQVVRPTARLPLASAAHLWGFEHSALYTALARAKATRWLLRLQRTWNPEEDPEQLLTSLVTRLRDLSSANRASLGLVLAVNELEVRNGVGSELGRLLGRVAFATGVPLLDLGPWLLDESPAAPGKLSLPGDVHWNPRGHAVVASAIEDFLACEERLSTTGMRTDCSTGGSVTSAAMTPSSDGHAAVPRGRGNGEPTQPTVRVPNQ